MSTNPEILTYNRQAWDVAVERNSQWTVPVDEATIAAAQQGDWSFTLTIARPVPRAWFPPLAGADVLCLAGAGGQQGPILAAAGARVTVFDCRPNNWRRIAMSLAARGWRSRPSKATCWT
jgi:hypothetical protein